MWLIDVVLFGEKKKKKKKKYIYIYIYIYIFYIKTKESQFFLLSKKYPIP